MGHSIKLPNKTLDNNVESARGAIPWLVAAVIAAVAPYIASLRSQFVLDDHGLIVNDPIAHSLANIPKTFLMDYLHGFLGNEVPYYYRPLTTISFQVNYAMAGPHPFIFRLTNLLLNLAVVLALFVLVKRIARSNFIAGVAAISFAVLPSHAESVAWVSGRTDILSTLFILLSLLAFMSVYSRRPAFSWPLAILCSVMLACALFSKESGLLALLLIAGYVWLFGKSLRLNELAKWVIVLLPTLLIYAILRKHVVGHALEGSLFYMLNERLAGVGIAYAAYLRMLFIPQELRLVYDVFPIGFKYPAIAAAAWLLPVGLVWLTVWTRKRAPVISFGALWIFLGLLPVSNILPTIGPLPAERFVYFASAGSSIIIGWIAWQLYQWKPKPLRTWPIVAGLLICWFVLYSGALAMRSSWYYESDLAWSHGIAASKTRFGVMRAAAGSTFVNAGYYKEAVEEYEAALALTEKSERKTHHYVGLAIAKHGLGQVAESAAVLIACRNDLKDSPEVEYQLGIDYALLGQYGNASAAFRRAVQLKPSFRFAWRNLGKAELKLGRYGSAITAYERAFAKVEPIPKDRLDIGRAYKGLGNLTRARREFEKVIHENAGSEAGRAATAEIKALGTSPAAPAGKH